MDIVSGELLIQTLTELIRLLESGVINAESSSSTTLITSLSCWKLLLRVNLVLLRSGTGISTKRYRQELMTGYILCSTILAVRDGIASEPTLSSSTASLTAISKRSRQQEGSID